jgi:hypothetical protein
MKIRRFSLSAASLALLAVQLVLVSAVAAKYLYQRWTCPKVWTRASAYDPALPMRGRYLSLQLTVDGCQSTLPSAKMATFPRNVDGTVKSGDYSIRSQQPAAFSASLKVEGNRLLAIRIEGQEITSTGETVLLEPGHSCDQMRLDNPVDFYIAEHAASPLPVKPGQELWVEVTVPPKGPPRPIQLAMKQDGAWKPLAFE